MATGGPPAKLTENIRDQFLQCKICLDGLKEPKTLPCLHTFCAECIHYYIEHNHIDSRKFACPICRRHIYIPMDGADGFPDSFFVTNLNKLVNQQDETGSGTSVESSDDNPSECGICKYKETSKPASKMCVECKISLCQECASHHSTAKITKEHTLLPYKQQGGTSRENYCRVHKGKLIQFYCETCNSAICLPCTHIDHQGHDIEDISKVKEKFTQDIKTPVMQSKDNLIQLRQTQDYLLDLEEELFVRREAVKTDVRRSVQENVRALDEMERQLLGEVDQFYDTLTLMNDRQKIEACMFKLERAHDFAEGLLSNDTSPITQISNRIHAKENLNQAMTYELPDVMAHAEKLHRFIHFLPSKVSIHLGALLKCTQPGHSNTVDTNAITRPSTKALFMHKLKVPDDSELGEVIALSFLLNGDVVALVSAPKKVKIFNKRGKMRYEFGDDDDLQHPSDLCVTHEGKLAISDCGLQCVKVYDQFAVLDYTFGNRPGEEDMFGLPISLATDHLGRFLVCDQGKLRITIHRSGGELLREVPIPEITLPQYITYKENQVYICDSDNNTIALYSYHEEETAFVAKMSAQDNGEGEFLDCSGITVDQRCGDLIITDLISDKIHTFNKYGEVSNIVPSGRAFLRPTCLDVSKEGILVVSQQGVVPLEPEQPSGSEVCVYKLLKADI